MGTYTDIYVHIYTERGLIQDQYKFQTTYKCLKTSLGKIVYSGVELNI